MEISGVGSVYSYNYNLATKRISSSEEREDEFVQYCNDEIKGEDTAELNGYDYRTKVVIKGFEQRMQWLYDAGLMDKPIAENGTEDVELTCKIEDSTTTSVYVNGEKHLTAIVPGVIYTDEEVRSFATAAPPFKTRVHQDYNPSDNSIHIAVGDKFTYGNGYTFTVGDTKVMGSRYDYEGKSDAENQAADRFMGAVNSLLHFADQQYISDMIDKDLTPQVLNFLREQGVDTSREFIINETRCEVKDGRIREVGNKTGIPNSIYDKALARYEEALEMPLNKDRKMSEFRISEVNENQLQTADKPLWHWHDGPFGYSAEVYKNERSTSEYTVKLKYDNGKEEERIVDAEKVNASSCNMVDLSVRMYHLEAEGKIENPAPDLLVAHLYLQHRMPNANENTIVDYRSWFEQQLDLELNENANPPAMLGRIE